MAVLQDLASNLKCSRNTTAVAFLFLKTLALRLFHSSRHTSINREAITFLLPGGSEQHGATKFLPSSTHTLKAQKSEVQANPLTICQILDEY
jgi:hypothetical protein